MAKAAMLGLFGLLVIIIVGIALVIYFGNKKGDEETLEETSEQIPEFTFGETGKIKYNKEESSGSQEGYRIIEYLANDHERSKLIDITLSWQTGAGFDKVNKIIFTRYVSTTTGTTTGTKIQEDIIMEKTKYPEMIKDYSNGTVTFKGDDIFSNVSVKGTNTVKAYYNSVDENNLLGTAEIKITEDDFSYTADGPFGEYEITITIVKGTFKLDKFVKKIYYNLSFIPWKWFKLQINTNTTTATNTTPATTTTTYSFKSIDGSDTLTLDGQTEFKLNKYKGKNLLIHPDDDDKVLVLAPNNTIFKKQSDMEREDWGLASFTLTAARTITPGEEDVEDIKQGIEYKSPNDRYSLKFQDDGNLVLRDINRFNKIKWESNTDAQTEGGDFAKRIVVRARTVTFTVDGSAALTFTKTDDFEDGNVIREDVSIGGNFKKPYILILDDTGVITIIDKTGFATQALDFLRTKGGLKFGDTFKCKNNKFIADEPPAFRYIGYNQRNRFKSFDALKRMHAQWSKDIKTVEDKHCGNEREGPEITDAVIADFPKLKPVSLSFTTSNAKFNQDLTKDFCTSDASEIEKLKENCDLHSTCGGLGQKGNNCWYAYEGLGYAWPEGSKDIYTGGLFNFNLSNTRGHYLFRR